MLALFFLNFKFTCIGVEVMERKTGQLAAKEECQTLKKKLWFHKVWGEG